jgi:hypothetical protein
MPAAPRSTNNLRHALSALFQSILVFEIIANFYFFWPGLLKAITQ